MMKILKEVLDEIKPSKEDEKKIKGKINNLLKKLNKNLKYAKAVLGGSGEKGTWLKDTHDADIFVQFDYKKFKNKSSELSDILERTIKKSFSKYERVHGSRDYFHIKDKDFIFEIVPVLKITKAEQADNITDVSLLHARWVKKNKRYADDIRLLKQFCKANKVYGAESYIHGFSGYVCEILVIYYKGFLKLMRNVSRWKDKVVIDAAGHYKNKNKIMFELNKSKLTSPMVVIDPVQKDRNAGAAISEEKFELFKKRAKDFIKKKKKDLFIIKDMSEKDIKSMETKTKKAIILEVYNKKAKEDVAGCRLLKAFGFFSETMQNYGFKVYDKGWHWDKEKRALFWYITDRKKISKIELREGPPLEMKEAVKDFKKAHKKTKTKNKKIYAEVKRRFTDPRKYVLKLIKDDYLKDKVNKIVVH